MIALEWYLAARALQDDQSTPERQRQTALVLTYAHKDNPEAYFEYGVLLHNAGLRPEARPWLEAAVKLDPTATTFREGLAKNVELLEGVTAASRVAQSGYIPEVNIEQLDAELRAAFQGVLDEILAGGRVVEDDLVLLDPEEVRTRIKGAETGIEGINAGSSEPEVVGGGNG